MQCFVSLVCICMYFLRPSQSGSQMSHCSLLKGVTNTSFNLLNRSWCILLETCYDFKVLLHLLKMVHFTAKVGNARAIRVQVVLLFDKLELCKAVQSSLNRDLKASLKVRNQVFVVHLDDFEVE